MLPNYVWFCTDQQRWDTISALGNSYLKTPNIDRLVREGVAFRNAYCQSPVCTPSRASFLTGRYPRTTKAFYNGNDCFSRDEVLVTRILADAGYTCGLTGKLHLTSAQGRMETRTNDGYSYVRWSHHPHDDWPGEENDYQNWLKSKGQTWEDIYGGRYTSMSRWPPVENPRFTGKAVGVTAQFHQTTWCVETAIEFIEQNKTGPWLVSINPFDPHPPLDPPQEYKDRLNISDMPLPLHKDGEMASKPPHQQKDYVIGGQNGGATPIASLSEEAQRERFRDYYAEIELIDDQLGRLIDYLDETGQRKDTVIIFMSDHGEMSGDHGLYWKGAYFYESLVHIPLIISWPDKLLKGVRSDALVELVDLAPTLLELSGLEIPPAMQGKSLMPLLTGTVSPGYHKDAVYCEYYSCLVGCHDDICATMYFDGRHKLVSYHGKDFGELYDLLADPGEFDNLWGKPEYAALLYELTSKNFDNAILNNLDFSMGRLYKY